jgi:hypothetical protein
VLGSWSGTDGGLGWLKPCWSDWLDGSLPKELSEYTGYMPASRLHYSALRRVRSSYSGDMKDSTEQSEVNYRYSLDPTPGSVPFDGACCLSRYRSRLGMVLEKVMKCALAGACSLVAMNKIGAWPARDGGSLDALEDFLSTARCDIFDERRDCAEVRKNICIYSNVK